MGKGERERGGGDRGRERKREGRGWSGCRDSRKRRNGRLRKWEE